MAYSFTILVHVTICLIVIIVHLSIFPRRLLSQSALYPVILIVHVVICCIQIHVQFQSYLWFIREVSALSVIHHTVLCVIVVAFHLVVCLVFVIAHLLVYPVLGLVHFALMAPSEP